MATAGAIGATSLAGCSAGPVNVSLDDSNDEDTSTEQTTMTTIDAPKKVEESRPGIKYLARKAIDKGYNVIRAGILKSGTIVLVLNLDTSGTGLKEAVKNIMLLYADTLKKHPKTGGLTIISGGIRAMVPKQPAMAYNRGDLEQKAYFETYTISEMDKTTTTTNGS